MLDATMGSFDGAELCELVGLFILNDLANKYGTNNIGLYRDDGLAIFKNTTGPQAERTRKEIRRRFKEHGLKITIQSNLPTAACRTLAASSTTTTRNSLPTPPPHRKTDETVEKKTNDR